jgi:hypothetical protein
MHLLMGQVDGDSGVLITNDSTERPVNCTLHSQFHYFMVKQSSLKDAYEFWKRTG